MRRAKFSRPRWAAIFALVSCLAAAPPALADARPLHLAVLHLQFTSFTCLNQSCSLASATAVGTATSNLATSAGTFDANLTIDFSPGGTCNIVDESDVFSFTNGSIFIHSHHEDCATHGLRIDTTFEITGGSGAFKGATGSGREFAAAPTQPPIIFSGEINY